MPEAAAFIAWLGAAVIVLSDGRRGLALGLALIAIGFAAIAWLGGDGVAAVALLAGGAVSAAQRLRSGPGNWGMMPPGSTSRLILTLVAGLLALWIAASVTVGAGAPIRFATLAVLSLMGARALQGQDPAVVLTAAAGLALAIALGSVLAGTPPGPGPYLVAAFVAAGFSFIRLPEPHGA